MAHGSLAGAPRPPPAPRWAGAAAPVGAAGVPAVLRPELQRRQAVLRAVPRRRWQSRTLLVRMSYLVCVVTTLNPNMNKLLSLAM